MTRRFTKYPSSYVRASNWVDDYAKQPYGYNSKSFSTYNAEDWAYYLADELGLLEHDYRELLYNIENLKADDWIDDWKGPLSNIRRRGLSEFYKFIHYSE